MTTTKLSVCMLSLVIMLPLHGMAEMPPHRLQLYQLFNHCRPMRLLVDVDFDEPVFYDLKAPIRELAKTRLRHYKLHTEDPRHFPLLTVDVDGFSLSFAVVVSYRKWLYDPITDITWLATTWREAALASSMPRTST